MAPIPNVAPHKFEVLYYLGVHKTLRRAAQKMPYGITPSALSRKLCDLEREIKLTLYDRETHTLTASGEGLFHLHKPIYERTMPMIKIYRQGLLETITIGASPVVLRQHLPPILDLMRQQFPSVRLACLAGDQKQIHQWLKEKTIDVGVMIQEGNSIEGYKYEVLTRLTLALLVPESSALRSANDVWRRRPITEKLIRFEEDAPITRCFSRELSRRKIEWPALIQAPSFDLAETFVASGLGVAVSVILPGSQSLPPGVRQLPLKNFPHLPVVLVWRDNPSQPAQALLKEMRGVARRLLA